MVHFRGSGPQLIVSVWEKIIEEGVVPRMSQGAHHLENGSPSPSENGVDRLAAADAAKAEANAHFKGLCIVREVLCFVTTTFC